MEQPVTFSLNGNPQGTEGDSLEGKWPESLDDDARWVNEKKTPTT
jgi:hypothetical protein